ncbi:hypothetical protein BDY24DRAFT_444192 [Mrakia frigida]|uniref:RNA recognition motif domain-containing protein n=1 Tax=Mrakia frigida TaxID=29902 RepID=UPI003FCC1DB2
MYSESQDWFDRETRKHPREGQEPSSSVEPASTTSLQEEPGPPPRLAPADLIAQISRSLHLPVRPSSPPPPPPASFPPLPPRNSISPSVPEPHRPRVRSSAIEMWYGEAQPSLPSSSSSSSSTLPSTSQVLPPPVAFAAIPSKSTSAPVAARPSRSSTSQTSTEGTRAASSRPNRLLNLAGLKELVIRPKDDPPLLRNRSASKRPLETSPVAEKPTSISQRADSRDLLDDDPSPASPPRRDFSLPSSTEPLLKRIRLSPSPPSRPSPPRLSSPAVSSVASTFTVDNADKPLPPPPSFLPAKPTGFNGAAPPKPVIFSAPARSTSTRPSAAGPKSQALIQTTPDLLAEDFSLGRSRTAGSPSDPEGAVGALMLVDEEEGEGGSEIKYEEDEEEWHRDEEMQDEQEEVGPSRASVVAGNGRARQNPRSLLDRISRATHLPSLAPPLPETNAPSRRPRPIPIAPQTASSSSSSSSTTTTTVPSPSPKPSPTRSIFPSTPQNHATFVPVPGKTVRTSDGREIDPSTLHLRKLDRSVQKEDLEAVFGAYGSVLSARIIDKPGSSVNFGFVTFASSIHAVNAKMRLNGKELGNGIIDCSYAETETFVL